jgi:predicted DNA-binding transcriptional regulator AlpA
MVSKTTEITTKTLNQRETGQILSVQEVADRLGIPKSSVYERVRFRGANKGSPLPCRRVGKYLKFLASEVDAWFLGLPPVRHAAKRKYTFSKPRRRKTLIRAVGQEIAA